MAKGSQAQANKARKANNMALVDGPRAMSKVAKTRKVLPHVVCLIKCDCRRYFLRA